MSLKIKKSQAVALLTALELPGAEKWNTERLATRLKKLPDALDGDEEIKDKDLKKLLASVVKAAEKGDAIEVTDDAASEEPAAEEKPTKKGKKSKPAPEPAAEEEDEESEEDEEEDEESEEDEKPAKKSKKSKDEKPAKKEKKSGPEKDKFGCRVGSQAAQINAVLGKKALPVEEIVEKTGLEAARVRAHLKAFEGKGKFKHIQGKGYAVA